MVANTAAQQAKALQAIKNRDFMRIGYPQPILCNATGGTAYNAGQLMNFDVPIVPGAYIEKIRVYWTLNFTNTQGATPGIALTPGGTGGYSLFSDFSLNFGNKQITMHPYFSKVLQTLRGYNRTPAGTVIGNNAAGVQTVLFNQPAIVNGANAWNGYFDVPTTLVHPSSPYGLLPIGGSGTRAQIQLTTAPALTGTAGQADPLNHAIAITAGATNALSAITGTVNVVVFYRDFKSMATPQALEADLTGLPTAQVLRLRDISPAVSGSLNFLSITNPYPFLKTASIIIDGQSSTKFCAANNIQAFRIDGAENTSSQLRTYDSTNGGMANYFSRHRELYGQDLDEGVIVFDANAENGVDSSNQEGEMWLNVSNSGYPAARLGFQVGTVSNTNITPRIVNIGAVMNPVGIS